MLISILGANKFDEVSSVRDYFISDDAPSKTELAVAKSFFDDQGLPFHLIIALEASDGGDLLRPE